MTPEHHASDRFAPEMMLAAKALAHPIRLAVVELVETSPCRFGELVKATGKKPGTLSPHLRQLQKGGILRKEFRPAGDSIREEYSLSRFGQRVLLAWDQAFGIPIATTVCIEAGSAGSETMEGDSMSERASMGSTVRITLEG